MAELKTREVLVLLSGGIDSSACLHFYQEIGRPPIALFVDYGQPAADQEAAAARTITEHYSIPLISLKWSSYQAKGAGLIPGRNSFLISAAVMERPPEVSIIAIGVHAGTAYPDCTQSFLDAAQTLMNLSGNPSLQLAAPFASWSKRDVVAYCRLRSVPLNLTYSCERGTQPPCGSCLSCADRSSFLASPSIRS